jgi:hypothetical protein
MGRSFHFQDVLLYLTELLAAQSIAQSLGLIFAWVVLDWKLVGKYTKTAARKPCHSKLECSSSGQYISKNTIAWPCVVEFSHGRPLFENHFIKWLLVSPIATVQDRSRKHTDVFRNMKPVPSGHRVDQSKVWFDKSHPDREYG